MNPFAVIISCYNKRPYLEEAVRSALLNDPTEVIVVDDGSLDGSLMEAQRLAALDSRITVIAQQNLGAAAARNAGWRASSAPWLVFLDGDDRLCPNFALQTLSAAHASGAALVSGYARMFGTRTDTWTPQQWDPYYIRYDNSLPISSLITRELVQKVDGFNAALPFAEDWDLWIRIGALCPTVMRLPEVVYEYRRTTEQNLSSFVDDKWGLTAPLMMLANQALYNIEDLKFAVARFIERGSEWREPLAKHTARHPSSALLALTNGLLAEGRVDLQAALNCYATALQHQGSDPVALWRIGNILLLQGQMPQAHALLHQARIVRPDMNFLVGATLADLTKLIAPAQPAANRR